ncbi:MAG: hypothetical protein D4R73_11150 [Deltaproteobacteria bacterium]|nr:MAG: hypothetical protein D4R73_11150 [Deltaproteobacteria bacterium]
MAEKDSTTFNPASVSIIKAYLEHLMDSVKVLRRLADDLATDDEVTLRSEMLGGVADKVQMAAEQIGYYFDPRFAEHREDTDRWIKRLEKARDENFSRLEGAQAPA